MLEQSYKINHLNLGRYHLTLPKTLALNKQFPKAYNNHFLFWCHLNKVILHSTSKKIHGNPELYGSLNIALSCIASQTPKMVKSKMSVSAFKVMSGSLMGALCYLRKHRRSAFCYKWTFVAPAVEDLKGSQQSTSIGLNNFFVFELDQLDYKAFEPLPGLYIEFNKQTK